MLKFLLLFVLGIFAFAPQVNAETLADYPTPFENQHSIMFYDSYDRYYFVAISSPDKDYSILLNRDISVEQKLKIYNTSGGNVSFYIYEWKGTTWKAYTSSLAGHNSTVEIWRGSTFNFIDSTIDISDETTGELVFPLPEEIPLHLLPGELMTENKEGLATKVLQAMMIILLCGVGCLALLTSLPILLKILRKFLAR